MGNTGKKRNMLAFGHVEYGFELTQSALWHVQIVKTLKITYLLEWMIHY